MSAHVPLGWHSSSKKNGEMVKLLERYLEAHSLSLMECWKPVKKFSQGIQRPRDYKTDKQGHIYKKVVRSFVCHNSRRQCGL